MSVSLPKQGIVFWPVGNGDSSTLCVDSKTIVQVDLNHLEKAGKDNDPHYPVIDHLVGLLPKNGTKKPSLSMFVLTHPDQDHCKGFGELMKKVTINEVWFTPRVFREYKKDLCDDAKAFRDEALRRVKLAIEKEGKLTDGDRVRIVGYDELLQEEEFKGFPNDLLVVPGSEITIINGESKPIFRAFIQAPFKDDAYGDRNDASLGMQVTLINEKKSLKALLLGDLAYPTMSRILTKSDADDLEWDILLAPHHCSKKVMYWKDENEDEETLRTEITKALEKSKLKGAYIIASAESDFTDGKGDDPPHTKARKEYEKIIDAGHFLCTQEYPNKEKPEPIRFELTENGITLTSKSESKKSDSLLSVAVAAARGGATPPHQQVGFGNV